MILLHLIVILGSLEIFTTEVNGQRRINRDQSIQLKNVQSEDINPVEFQDYIFGQREILTNVNRRRRQHETKDISFLPSVATEPRKRNTPPGRINKFNENVQNSPRVKRLQSSTNNTNDELSRPNESAKIKSNRNNFRERLPRRRPIENTRNPTSKIQKNSASPNNTIVRQRISTTPRENIDSNGNSNQFQENRRTAPSQRKSNFHQENNVRRTRVRNNGQRRRKNEVNSASYNSRPIVSASVNDPSTNSRPVTPDVNRNNGRRKRISVRNNSNITQESRQFEITQNSSRFIDSMKKFEAARVSQTIRPVVPTKRTVTPYQIANNDHSEKHLNNLRELKRVNGARFSIPILPELEDSEKNRIPRIEPRDSQVGQSYLRRVRSHNFIPSVILVGSENVDDNIRRIESANSGLDVRGIVAEKDVTKDTGKIPAINGSDIVPGTKTESPPSVDVPFETKLENDPSETNTESNPSETKMENDPSEAKKGNDPSETATENNPSETKLENNPSETKTENGPPETKTENDPSENKTENGPSETKTENGPSETKTENGPSENKTENGPSETKTENDPSESKTENGPSETKTENDPSENKTENGPSETKTEDDPSENKMENGPSETKTENDPSENKKANGPSETKTEDDPSENKMENGPSETKTENDPLENKTENGPSENKTENDPSENKTENGPSGTNLENDPSENKIENDPSLTKMENDASENKVENGPSVTKMENGPSVTKMENDPSENKMGNDPSENKLQNDPSENKIENDPSENKMENDLSENKMENDPSENKMEKDTSENKTEMSPSENKPNSETKTEIPPGGHPNENIIVDPYEREEGKSIIYPIEWSVLGYPLNQKAYLRNARPDDELENVRIVSRCRLGYFLSLHTNTCIGKTGRKIPSVILERLRLKS